MMQILLVDGSSLYRSILKKALAKEEIHLEHVTNGKQALSLAQEKCVEIVVISLTLEDMNGLELTRQLRQCPNYKHIPIVLLTSSDSEELDKLSQKTGITETFHKQDIEELVNFMRRFLTSYTLLYGHVLYVEDTPSQREILTQQLKQWGLKVDTFASADEAWPAFLENKYDLVITDIFLDGQMSGSRFVNQIRRQPGAKGDTPILAVTAYDNATRRVELFHLGVSDYVTKPIIPEEIHARIHSLISRKQIIDRDQHLLNATSLAVITINERGLIQCVNDETVRMFGYTKEELIAQDVTLLMPEPHRTQHQQYVSNYLASGNSRVINIWERELSAIRKSGEEFPIHLSVTEVIQFGKRVFAGIIRDVSMEQRAHEELKKAHIMAEEASKAKSAFLANMSHEIRTPLNAILGLAQIGLRESLHDDKMHTLLEKMFDSGKMLQGIIDDILDFSKIEAGKLIIENTPFKLEKLLSQLHTLAAPLANAKGLTLSLSLEEELPDSVNGDLLRTSQILGNLLSNAVKFTEKGEVTLEVKKVEQGLLFTVTDTGIGITDEQIQRLFDAFEQADPSITRKFGGTGLGLSISKKLIDLMDGTIQVRSQPEIGSTFEVKLPLLAAEPLIANESDPPLTVTSDQPRLEGCRILVAEDNELNQLVLDDMLTHEGAIVTCVEDGIEALELLEKLGVEHWDILITDVQMPRMDGYQLAREVKQHYPSLPIIGLTAHAMKEDQELCLSSGMSGYLSKPVEIETLVTSVRRYAIKSN